MKLAGWLLIGTAQALAGTEGVLQGPCIERTLVIPEASPAEVRLLGAVGEAGRSLLVLADIGARLRLEGLRLVRDEEGKPLSTLAALPTWDRWRCFEPVSLLPGRGAGQLAAMRCQLPEEAGQIRLFRLDPRGGNTKPGGHVVDVGEGTALEARLVEREKGGWLVALVGEDGSTARVGARGVLLDDEGVPKAPPRTWIDAGGVVADQLAAAPRPGGGVALAWVGWHPRYAESGPSLFVARFGPEGGAEGEVTLIASGREGRISSPAIATIAESGIAIAWIRSTGAGDSRVLLRRLAADGTVVGEAEPVSEEGAAASGPELLSAGGALWALWLEGGEVGRLMVQRLDTSPGRALEVSSSARAISPAYLEHGSSPALYWLEEPIRGAGPPSLYRCRLGVRPGTAR